MTTSKLSNPNKPNKPNNHIKPKDPIQESSNKTKTKTSGAGAPRGTHAQDTDKEKVEQTGPITRARAKINNMKHEPELVIPEKIQSPKENTNTRLNNSNKAQNRSSDQINPII